MRPILIAYATREGQTRRICEHIDEYLVSRGVPTSRSDLADATPLYIADFAAVVLAASVHDRAHEPEAVEFAKRHHAELNEVPCLVLSVSAAQIVAESERAPAWLRRLAASGAQELLRRFLADTRLVTGHAHPVAGALAYSKYHRAQRWVFRACARLAGLSYDEGNDQAFTDLAVVERHIVTLLDVIPHHPAPARAAAAKRGATVTS